MEEARKMKALRIFLFVSLTAKLAMSSPSGAPATQAVCDSLTPGHEVDSQQGPSPFSLVISPTTVKGGDIIKVEIQSSDGRTFRGFYIQARTTEAEFQVLGEFLEDENETTPFNFRSCGGRANNAVTHFSRDDKSSIRFSWKAPQNFVGTMNFQ